MTSSVETNEVRVRPVILQLDEEKNKNKNKVGMPESTHTLPSGVPTAAETMDLKHHVHAPESPGRPVRMQIVGPTPLEFLTR